GRRRPGEAARRGGRRPAREAAAAAAADDGDRRQGPARGRRPAPRGDGAGPARRSLPRPHLPLLLLQPPDGRRRHQLRLEPPRPARPPAASPASVVPGQAAPSSGALIAGFVEPPQPLQGGAAPPGGDGPPVGLPWYIPWSVGNFDRPNRYEAEAAREILDD